MAAKRAERRAYRKLLSQERKLSMKSKQLRKDLEMAKKRIRILKANLRGPKKQEEKRSIKRQCKIVIAKISKLEKKAVEYQRREARAMSRNQKGYEAPNSQVGP
jgi:hypothetical protein